MNIRKLFAIIIDYIVVLCFSFFVNILLGIILGVYTGIIEGTGGFVDYSMIDRVFDYVGYLALLIFVVLYYSHISKSCGQTIGDKILKIKIIPISDKITLLPAIVRLIFFAPLLSLIGFIYISYSPPKTLLDYLSKTNTLRTN